MRPIFPLVRIGYVHVGYKPADGVRDGVMGKWKKIENQRMESLCRCGKVIAGYSDAGYFVTV
jgi:hypothetical protein